MVAVASIQGRCSLWRFQERKREAKTFRSCDDRSLWQATRAPLEARRSYEPFRSNDATMQAVPQSAAGTVSSASTVDAGTSPHQHSGHEPSSGSAMLVPHRGTPTSSIPAQLSAVRIALGQAQAAYTPKLISWRHTGAEGDIFMSD